MKNQISRTFIGLAVLLLGYYFATVYSVAYKVENLSQEFINQNAPPSVLPPELWSPGVIVIGVLIMIFGLLLVLPWEQIFKYRKIKKQ